MTQKQRIVETLSKRPLTTLDAAILGLGTKVNSRICELEKELNFRCKREPKKNKHSHWLEYSVNKKDLKTLKNYLKSDK